MKFSFEQERKSFGKTDTNESIDRDDAHEPGRDRSGRVEHKVFEFAKDHIQIDELEIVFLFEIEEKAAEEHERVDDRDRSEIDRYRVSA